jgi:hypothetical protein
MTQHRIYTTSFASVYPHYVAKAERKGRTKAEVDEIIRWLTGLSQPELDARIADRSDFETFFAQAPKLHPARAEIKGVICGVRVEEIAEPLMREIRYLDKLIDELAKGHGEDPARMTDPSSGQEGSALTRGCSRGRLAGNEAPSPCDVSDAPATELGPHPENGHDP